MNILSSVEVDKGLEVNSTEDLSPFVHVNQNYYIYYDQTINKFKLSKPFTTLLDTTTQQDYEFQSGRILTLYTNRTYKFIMKSNYNDLNDGSLTNKMDERFLIWTNRNYTTTLDIRLGTPQEILGDPMGISYYVNNNTNSTTYSNYKVSNNTSSELRFTPTAHDTLYYFSTLQNNAGKDINILPEKFLEGSNIINGGMGVKGNMNIDDNMLLKTNHFKVERNSLTDIKVGVNNNRTRLDLAELNGGVVVPKGNKLTIGYNHLQKYESIVKTNSNRIINLVLENEAFINVIVIKNTVFNNDPDLQLSVYKVNDDDSTSIIYSNDSVLFNQTYYSRQFTYWPDTVNPQGERDYTNCYRKRFTSIKLKKLRFVFNNIPNNPNITTSDNNISNLNNVFSNINEYNVEIWKMGEKPEKTIGILRFNIETKGFEGQFENEIYPLDTTDILAVNSLYKYEFGINNWPSIGGIKDIDLDTNIDTTDVISFNTGNNNPPESTERMFIKEDDSLTKIGIGTDEPHATLDITHNLNITKDTSNNTSGVNIGHNTEGSVSDYINININASNNPNSIHFSSVGNYNIDLQNSYIIDVEDNYIIKSNDLNMIVTNFNNLKVLGNSNSFIGGNKYNKIVENNNINCESNIIQVIGSQDITVNENFNSSLHNNKSVSLVGNLGTIIKENLTSNTYGETTVNYKNDFKSSILSNLNTTIDGNVTKTVHDNMYETFKNKTSTVHNNILHNINTNRINTIGSLDSDITGIEDVNYKQSLIIKNNTFNQNIDADVNKIVWQDNLIAYKNNFDNNITNNIYNNTTGSSNLKIKSDKTVNISKNKDTFIAYGTNKTRTLTVKGNYNNTTTENSICNFDNNETIHITDNLVETYNGTMKWNINSSTVNIHDNNFKNYS